jgi:Uncharacterized protein conserved in bacteria
MVQKQDLIQLLTKEFATTQKVIRAFPEDKLDFAPHERSQSAGRLMSTFVFENYLLAAYILGEKVERERFQNYKPTSLEQVLSDFIKENKRILAAIEKMPDEELMNKEVNFANHTFTADRFILMMLFDQIHHRGQLSVYVRMAGGKVPSIYGPSADDSTTNF